VRVHAPSALTETISGTLTLTLDHATIAHGRFRIPRGATQSATVTLTISRPARKLLAKKGRLRPLATARFATSKQAARNDRTRLTIRPPLG
jgi:hypothetical protein